MLRFSVEQYIFLPKIIIYFSILSSIHKYILNYIFFLLLPLIVFSHRGVEKGTGTHLCLSDSIKFELCVQLLLYTIENINKCVLYMIGREKTLHRCPPEYYTLCTANALRKAWASSIQKQIWNIFNMVKLALGKTKCHIFLCLILHNI